MEKVQMVIKKGEKGARGKVLLPLPFILVNTFSFHFPNVDICCMTFDLGFQI